MKVSLQEVEHLAHLAALEFTPEEKQKIATELERILEYVRQLEEVDTTGVEPLEHPGGPVQAMRPDEPQPSLPVEEALRNAPDRQGGFFRVPRVIRK